MPRYYIHQVHKGECIKDEEGDHFADRGELRQELLLAARQIMSDRLLKGEALDHSRFEVRDERGALVLVFPFKDAIPSEEDENG